jgi:RNA polymerase primary sigma factor
LSHNRDWAIIDLLIEKAGIQGYLTTEDLMEMMPDADTERVNAILTVLKRHGVEVFDQGDDGSDLLSDDDNSEFNPPRFEMETGMGDALASDDTIGLYLKEMSHAPAHH